MAAGEGSAVPVVVVGEVWVRCFRGCSQVIKARHASPPQAVFELVHIPQGWAMWKFENWAETVNLCCWDWSGSVWPGWGGAELLGCWGLADPLAMSWDPATGRATFQKEMCASDGYLGFKLISNLESGHSSWQYCQKGEGESQPLSSGGNGKCN